MRTTLYVLGAVLGAAPVPLAVREKVPEARKAPDAAGDNRTRRTEDAPRHPCQLITVMQVPCDPSKAICEYTYWECPAVQNPLRA